jgi:hypothetical protein
VIQPPDLHGKNETGIMSGNHEMRGPGNKRKLALSHFSPSPHPRHKACRDQDSVRKLGYVACFTDDGVEQHGITRYDRNRFVCPSK